MLWNVFSSRWVIIVTFNEAFTLSPGGQGFLLNKILFSAEKYLISEKHCRWKPTKFVHGDLDSVHTSANTTTAPIDLHLGCFAFQESKFPIETFPSKSSIDFEHKVNLHFAGANDASHLHHRIESVEINFKCSEFLFEEKFRIWSNRSFTRAFCGCK